MERIIGYFFVPLLKFKFWLNYDDSRTARLSVLFFAASRDNVISRRKWIQVKALNFLFTLRWIILDVFSPRCDATIGNENLFWENYYRGLRMWRKRAVGGAMTKSASVFPHDVTTRRLSV